MFKHRYLLFTTSTAVFDMKPVRVFDDGRELQINFKEARYDDEEFMVLLEMVKRGKAYSNVQHYKRCTTGIMFERTAKKHGEPTLDLWVRLKDDFLNPSATII